jgi:hypothetical protein
MAATAMHAIKEELLKVVFSMLPVGRLYNEACCHQRTRLELVQLSLETVVRRVGS